MPQAVIFDLDGCLVDSEILSISAITEEIQDMGAPQVTYDYIRDRFLGVSMRVICEHVAEQTGKTCADDFVDRVEARLFARYRTDLRQIEGAAAMLDTLRDMGIPVAIATGGSIRRMGETLGVSGLAGYFQGAAFSADQVERGKPAPDLFLLAARELGVDPADCVVMEDSPHGIQGALAAGMRAVGFVGGSHLDPMREAHRTLLLSKGAERVCDTIPETLNAMLIR
ncbi:HAD family hydrolase [Donghicola mangrovi]|uniref:HAD family phosphatase n=1 Tax=Donghicola mangrovi TaxID=2729614 RepID=A0A850Q3T8_9RHOB|nr:HAD family phosphatase [Donghicola mangrovi]NVO24337.1 HAD family phosphatase [Donghicola mangrovi]